MRVILIGGTSHAGKSTLAEAVAGRLGWALQSTDGLARHPGRPWATAPGREAVVAAYYRSHTVGELVADVVRHYRDNVWPQVEALVAEQLTAAAGGPRPGNGLVIEGSAILPGLAVGLVSERVGAVWVVGSEALILARVHANSGYAGRTPGEREAIDRFAQRAVAFNARTLVEVERSGLKRLGVGAGDPPEELARRCLALLLPEPGGGTPIA